MPHPSTIRPAVFADASTIALLLNELNREEGYETQSDAGEIARALFAPTRPVDMRALVAQMDGNVVAVLMYYAGYDTLSASYGYHLADMVVAKAHRQQGIGKAMVKALAHETLGNEKAWLSLTVLRRNAAARKFYKSLGMTEVDVDFFAMGPAALSQL